MQGADLGAKAPRVPSPFGSKCGGHHIGVLLWVIVTGSDLALRGSPHIQRAWVI
jgi:hypothetical protein